MCYTKITQLINFGDTTGHAKVSLVHCRSRLDLLVLAPCNGP